MLPVWARLVLDGPAAARLLYLEDRFGNRTSYAYTGLGQVYKITDPNREDNRPAYNGSTGNLTYIRDGNRLTKFVINSSGNLTQITDPDSVRAFTFTYDSSHRLISYTDRRGATWDIAYDAHQKLASVTGPAIPMFGSNDPVRRKTTFVSWEKAVLPASCGTSGSPATRVLPGNVRASVTDARSQITRMTLNHLRAPTFVQRPLNDTTRLFWNDSAQVTTVRAANGYGTNYTWSGGNLSQVQEAFTGAVTTIEYDPTLQRGEEGVGRRRDGDGYVGQQGRGAEQQDRVAAGHDVYV